MPRILYTKNHEWLLVDGQTITVGITDYAQETLGEIVFIELPDIGRICNKGEPFSVIESVKSASDIYSPITGEVTKINEELNTKPEQINASAESKGWICTLQANEPVEETGFLDHARYLEFVGSDN